MTYPPEMPPENTADSQGNDILEKTPQVLYSYFLPVNKCKHRLKPSSKVNYKPVILEDNTFFHPCLVKT